ncbi:urease subunit beta [Natronomonas sp. F2-12]|jgi:urease subunit beta|uniref:Urease subunit beta n=1 Tax=Natronomonas aquatica TaxID=2841590 RepID=A0A9R1CUR5_9EURY|nr:urease subunit beta [Natronomonas aquatica]MCQ4333916.1 urease subunit beta [Natronomonas aquatica]
MSDGIHPGEIVPGEGTVALNEGRETAEVTVGNTGDRPVQVGSHFHFFEANAALSFDRKAAYGKRLNIPAGTAVRFEPGDRQTVELVDIGGKRVAHGMNGMVDGSVDGSPDEALERLRAAGFADAGVGGDGDGAAGTEE